MSQWDDFHNCNLCTKKFFTKTGLKLHFEKLHVKQVPNNDNQNQVKLKLHFEELHFKQVPNNDTKNQDKETGIGSANLESKKDIGKMLLTTKENTECEVPKEIGQNNGKKDNFSKRKNKPIQCSICYNEFKRRQGLQRHMQAVHEKQKPFKFPICVKYFSRNVTLIDHVKTVHEKQKLFKCQICDKNFAYNNSMNRHIKAVHEKQKPFRCQICEKDFARIDKMNWHVKSVHEKT